MTAGLGIGIGSANLVAVAANPTGEMRQPVRHPSAVHLDNDSVIGGFVERVGDPVPILAPDGTEHLGENLTASAMSLLVDAARGDGTMFESIVVAHPVAWNRHTTLAMESALDAIGIPGTTFVSEPEAVMTWLRQSTNALPDGLTVIYDLGASSLDVTLMSTADRRSAVFGKPLSSADIGGDEFDHSVTVHLLSAVSDHFGTLDPFAPGTIAALEVLRLRSRQAKENLSTDTETVIHVELPELAKDIRLVRSELEDLIRPALTESVALVRESLRCAGVESSDINHVVLAGGSSAIPLVAELLSAELRVPVIAAANPGSCAATGAAAMAVDPATTAKTTAATVPTIPVRTPAPVPAFSTPLMAEPTVEVDSETRRSSRVGIVAAVVGAFIVLAAGGLGIGTAMDKINIPSSAADTTGETTAPSGSTTTPTTVNSFGGSTIGGTGAAASDTSGNNSLGNQTGSPTAQVTATVIAGVPTTGAPAGSAPAPGATTTSVPAPGAPTVAPAPTLAPAPAPGPGGQTGGAGNAIGDAANGIGNGLGAVVGGAGDAVGGVLDSVGGLVGGVVGAVTPNR